MKDLLCLAVVSYLGNYGHGLGLLPHGLDLAIIAIFSLTIFALGLKLRLSNEESRGLVAADA
jgi:hypothetical protein